MTGGHWISPASLVLCDTVFTTTAEGDTNHPARSGTHYLNLQWWEGDAVAHGSNPANCQPQDLIEG